MHGAIWDKWAQLGWERSPLGYPTSNEYRQRGTDKKVRISRFQHGHITWSAADGAHDHAEPAPALPQLHVVPIYWGSTWQVNGGIAGVTLVDMHAAAQKIINGP